ncbi:cleavage stimulating factor 64 [Tanacetum coccineum]
MLQMPNARPLPGQHTHLPVQVGQQSSIQPLSGLPPLAQNKVQPGFMPQSQSQPSTSQYSAPSFPLQPRFQTPLPGQHQVLQNPTLSGLPATGNLQTLHPQHPGSLPRVENQLATSTSMLQYPGQHASANLRLNSPLVASIQPSIPSHQICCLSMASMAFHRVGKMGRSWSSSSYVSAIPNNGKKDHDNPQHLMQNPAWGRKVDPHPNMASASRLHENASFVNDIDQIGHPSKLLKMEDAVPLSGNPIPKAAAVDTQKQNHELPPGIDSDLLQQVLNLTPEQLSSLPPDQQQQVIQLQQMLRQSS